VVAIDKRTFSAPGGSTHCAWTGENTDTAKMMQIKVIMVRISRDAGTLAPREFISTDAKRCRQSARRRRINDPYKGMFFLGRLKNKNRSRRKL
jgi:hypothetical protein